MTADNGSRSPVYKNKEGIRKERSPVRNPAPNIEYRDRSRSKEARKEDVVDEERGRTKQRAENNDMRANDNSNNNNNGDDNDMMKLMGFSTFETTKNKHVEGVGNGSVKKNKKAKFRQYMNRNKGFNRELSPERRKK